MTSKHKTKKSLRNLLVFWFLIFSITPLAFLTGYSVVKYEQALDLELSERLRGNSREVQIILQDFQNNLISEARVHSQEKSLGIYLTANQQGPMRDFISRWLKISLAQKIWIWSAEGRLEVAMTRDSNGEIVRQEKLEKSDVFLNEEFIKKIQSTDEYFSIDLKGDKKTSNLELVVFMPLYSNTGKRAGYLEEVISMPPSFFQSLKNRLGVDIWLTRVKGNQLVSTHNDIPFLKTDPANYLEDGKLTESFQDLTLREVPYRFRFQPMGTEDSKLVLGLGVIKSSAKSILKNVSVAFFSVTGTVIVLLAILSFIMSRAILKPIENILNAIDEVDFEKGVVEIQGKTDNELGILTESFNEMARKAFESQKALKEKIQQLESANLEIRDTQSKLVQSAKMAGLGQMVAGIAHELNNPIGFIYSNMSHLKDYTNKLLDLIAVAEKDPMQLDAEKEKVDFDYIAKDIPKLIASCEEGARRTKDIVLGLRNFSRLDEAQLKDADIHEGIDNTLRLLSGELKNRIQIKKKYGHLPRIQCYASQLNQVFMNILSNAAQAIEGEGTIEIETYVESVDHIVVKIRDNGAGMSKATMEKIFDPFFTTKSQGSGTGLGLSISYGIIENHKGELSVSSKLKEGTEFKIRLPIRQRV